MRSSYLRTEAADHKPTHAFPQTKANGGFRGSSRVGGTQLPTTMLLLLIVFAGTPANGFEPVRAELGKTTAWTGEPVPLIVTLYSPATFSGTASFDLPDLPQTAFVKRGSPLVGSENVDDESYATQRHEFMVYTQRSGEIRIPAFRVRYSGKKSFTGEAEPMQGSTAELQFESKRPPGTDSMQIVVSAVAMDVEQAWEPEPTGKYQTGDVVIRTITRRAEGTTGMMLPPVDGGAPAGIRVYEASPTVFDKQERGDATAHRSDVLKYQLQSPGRLKIPDLTFAWWDPEQEKILRTSVEGREVEVSAAPASSTPARSPRWPLALMVVAGFLVAGWLLRRPLEKLRRVWHSYFYSPEKMAARKLQTACQTNNAHQAYDALMAWRAAERARNRQRDIAAEDPSLHEAAQALAKYLFATRQKDAIWQGTALWTAFSQARRGKIGPVAKELTPLPPLNPTSD